jgi:hypothetical protein
MHAMRLDSLDACGTNSNVILNTVYTTPVNNVILNTNYTTPVSNVILNTIYTTPVNNVILNTLNECMIISWDSTTTTTSLTPSFYQHH